MKHAGTDLSHEALRGHLAMLLFSALVAGSFSLGALAANDITPMVVTTWRFAFGAVLIGSIIVARGQAHTLRLQAPWRYLLLGSIFASYFVLMFEGLKTADPVPMAAVFTLTPIMAAGFGWFLLRQITNGRIALALTIGAVGALWVIFRGSFAALLAFDLGYGEAVFFIGSAMHALYVPLIRKLSRGESALASTFGVLLAGTLVLAVLSAPQIVATDWAHLPPIVWAVLIYVTIFATSTTFTLVQYATLRLPSSKVMAYTYLTPSWVILWELALGHSAPPMLILGGVGLTVLALAMLLKNER